MHSTIARPFVSFFAGGDPSAAVRVPGPQVGLEPAEEWADQSPVVQARDGSRHQQMAPRLRGRWKVAVGAAATLDQAEALALVLAAPDVRMVYGGDEGAAVYLVDVRGFTATRRVDAARVELAITVETVYLYALDGSAWVGSAVGFGALASGAPYGLRFVDQSDGTYAVETTSPVEAGLAYYTTPRGVEVECVAISGRADLVDVVRGPEPGEIVGRVSFFTDA